jgi:hypothetical protein
MPYGVAWRIIYIKFGGGDLEVGRTRQDAPRKAVV